MLMQRRKQNSSLLSVAVKLCHPVNGLFDISGRNIWSLSVNQTEDLIATGGGDGSVRLWSLASPDQDSRSTVREACLPSSNSTDKTGSQKNKKEDHPRFVTLLDQSSLLVMTNEGYVLHADQFPYFTTIS